MKVLGAEVNWMEQYANNPFFVVTVDRLPERSDLVFRRYSSASEPRGGDFVAEREGYVTKIYKHDILIRDEGFGGARQTLHMEDGATVEFFGGWHGATCYSWNRPEWGNGLAPFTECEWRERDGRFPRLGYSGWITLELLTQVIAVFLPGIELYQGDCNFYPKRVGEEPKNPRSGKTPFIHRGLQVSAEQMLL